MVMPFCTTTASSLPVRGPATGSCDIERSAIVLLFYVTRLTRGAALRRCLVNVEGVSNLVRRALRLELLAANWANGNALIRTWEPECDVFRLASW